MVKAIAEARGWRHDGHAQLFRVINQLTEETGDRELAGLFRGACALHTNFYEQWLPSEDVERAAEDINQLVQKLDGLLGVAA